MSNTIDIHVVDSEGDDATGRLVKVTITGVFSGGELKDYTDDNGNVSFETYDDYENSREMYIRVGDYLE